jgi:hypothetical protein
MLLPATPAPTSQQIAVPANLPPASPLAVGIPERFLQYSTIELARRIVAGIDEPLQLAVAMGLTTDQWQVLESHPHFRKVMEQARTDANSPAGLADQVRLKALVALNEGGVLDMVDVMSNTSNAPAVRKGAFDSLADVAGITKQKDQQAAQVGAGPLVMINFPAGVGAPVTIGARVIDV